MKSVFISHKFTGLSFEEMDTFLSPVVRHYEDAWVPVFCSLYLEDWFKQQQWDVDMIYERCCKQQELYEITIWIIWSDSDSYWMSIELHRAISLAKPYILLYKAGLENMERLDKYISSSVMIRSFANMEEYKICISNISDYY